MFKIIQKVVVVLLVLTLAAFLVIGCAPKEKVKKEVKEEAVKKKEIILVAHTSLTGGLADYGLTAKNGIELAVKDFSPFRVGSTEYVIKLISMDDKGEPAESAIVAQNAVDRGAIAVIGALTSGNTNAALPVYKKNKIPVISGSATLAGLAKAHENFFRTCLSDALQGRVLGKWVVELGFKKVAVMDDKGDYAVGLGDEVEKVLKDAKIETLREHCTEGDTDFSAQIQNIKSFGAEVVVFTGYHREAGLLRKQMVEQGLKNIKLMGGDGIKSTEIFKEAGGAQNMEGALCTFASLEAKDMRAYDEFKEKYKKAYGKDPGPYSENNYDAVGILVEAIKKANSLKGENIIKALHEAEYTGVIGTLSFDEDGEIQIKGKDVSAFITKSVAQNGQWVPYQK